MKKTPIKALLFDAGHTLVYPGTGNWFIPLKYADWFQDHLIRVNGEEVVQEALHKAYRFLDENHAVPDEAGEFIQFKEFYRIWLDHLTMPDVLPADTGSLLVEKLARDLVYNHHRFRKYPDVDSHLAVFSRKYKLAIISDTWPSLDPVFRTLGLRDYFSGFVMSAVLGTTKPDSRMYTTALDQLGVEPESAVFVDDSEICLAGAENLGIKGILINRLDDRKSDQYPTIFGLDQLESLIAQ